MFLQVSDIPVHVQIDGSPGAPPLLMLHSLGTSLHVWDGQVPTLVRHYRVIRPDLRGHGLSGVTPGPYTIEGMARDCLAVLDALGIQKAHIAGLSIGGIIAQTIAAHAPDRVASLVLCDTAMAIPGREIYTERAATVRAKGMEAIADAVMTRWVTPGFMHSPEAQGLRAMLLRTAPEGYAAAGEAIVTADLSSSTQGLRVPALVLVGEKDEATPPASAESLRKAIAESSLEVIPNASHIPTVEQPQAVADAIHRFLSPVLRPAGTDYYEAGMAVRKQVLGDAHVARATNAITDIDREFQHFITRTAWGGVWTRPHFDRRTRSLLTLALMATLGHHDEFQLHVRATRNTGATPEDIAELLIHVAAYAGIPAANTAVRIAKETLKEMAM
jgi:3-oxoadipate enol-lactonase / 4-carboxymuconolactone decarboxylase